MVDIVLAAVITFVISGIGGVMLEKWLNKAKPSIAISRITFGYSSQSIQVEEDLIRLVQSIPWDIGMGKNTSTYNTGEILDWHDNVTNLIEELRQAVSSCEQWMEIHHHEPKRRKGTPDLQINDVKSHPFFRHSIISRSLIGDIARFAIEHPPVELKTIRSSTDADMPVMFDLYQEELVNLWKKDEKSNSIRVDSEMVHYVKTIDDTSISNLVLLASGFRHYFNRSNIKTEEQRCNCTLLAESFSRCIDSNIFYYTEEFINHSLAEVNRLEQLQRLLLKIIEELVTIFIRLYVYNFGQTATAIDSTMGLKVFNRTRGDSKLLFRAVEISFSDFLSSSNSGSQQVENSRYISLNPSSSCRIDLQLFHSINVEEIKELRNIYNTGILTCQLLANTKSP